MLEKEKEVLVVPRDKLFTTDTPHGFFAENLEEIRERIVEHCIFVPRVRAEDDPSLKQIIPYTIITGENGIFLLKRFNTQDESRLHDKYSIGVGGHINPAPVDKKDLVEDGLRREIEEEIEIAPDYRAQHIGFINDDSNPVGSVHFGVVFKIDAGGSPVVVRESALMSGEFRVAADVAKLKQKMESWSQFLVENFAQLGFSE